MTVWVLLSDVTVAKMLLLMLEPATTNWLYVLVPEPGLLPVRSAIDAGQLEAPAASENIATLPLASSAYTCEAQHGSAIAAGQPLAESIVRLPPEGPAALVSGAPARTSTRRASHLQVKQRQVITQREARAKALMKATNR